MTYTEFSIEKFNWRHKFEFERVVVLVTSQRCICAALVASPTWRQLFEFECPSTKYQVLVTSRKLNFTMLPHRISPALAVIRIKVNKLH